VPKCIRSALLCRRPRCLSSGCHEPQVTIVSISSRSSRDLQAQVPALPQRLDEQAEDAGKGALTVSTMTDAVLSTQVVSQAVGIVMERFELSSTRAFEYLVRTAKTSQCKLGSVAAELVTRASEPDDPGGQA
jgi:ANTAR domain